MRQASQPYRAPSVCLFSRCPAPWHMAGIVPQLHQITAQHSTARHATAATTSPEHHAPCAPVLPEPPPLQPPSRELQIAMPWHKCKHHVCAYTLCKSIAYLAAKYSIPLLSFEARAASHRGSTLYCTLHGLSRSSVWDLFEDLGDL
ncbi:hypothetical protein V8C34DRAFT_286241 [Trichoderma compactum]